MNLGTLGKYRLLSHLSSGGMAELYRALAIGPDGFRRLVVVKKIRAEFASDPQFLEMFRDEAAIASKLTHSNIAQVYGFDVEEGEPYIVMEYVEGKDLRSIMRHCQANRRPIPYPMALYTAAAAADGLQYVHTRKERGKSLAIVHRDVSPQNIMISHAGEVKILDFGVARAACRTSETQTGVIKGKYGYMSPEQVRGRPMDHRSDIFSLGVVLWEMLTLRRLFASENDILTAENVCQRPAPPPHHIRTDLPKDLDPILQRALAKDPNERYASAQEFRDDISVLLMSAGAYPTPDQVADFVYKLFPQDMEALRQGDHLLDVDEELLPDSLPGAAVPAQPVLADSGTRKVERQPLPDLLPLPTDASLSQESTQPDPTSPLLNLPELPSSLSKAPDSSNRILRRWTQIMGLALLAVMIAVGAISAYRFFQRQPYRSADSAGENDPKTQEGKTEQIAKDAPKTSEAKPATPDAGTKPPQIQPDVPEIAMSFRVQPPTAWVFVDGVRFSPGVLVLRKTPGQPMVVEVAAPPNYIKEKRLVEAQDGTTHDFRLKEAGLLTFIVSPADAEVEVDGKKALGSRARFGWEGVAGDQVHVRIGRAGVQYIEEEVTIPRGTQTRTYKLTKANATLVSVKTEERPKPALSPASPSLEPASPGSAQAPSKSLASALGAWLDSETAPKTALATPPPVAAPPQKASQGAASKKAAKKAQEQAQARPTDQPPIIPKDPPETESPQPGKGTPGIIRVNARPYADIFFRGKPWGKTPKDIEVQPGTYEVTLKYPTASHTCKVQVTSGAVVPCSFEFEPQDSGAPEGENDQKNP